MQGGMQRIIGGTYLQECMKSEPISRVTTILLNMDLEYGMFKVVKYLRLQIQLLMLLQIWKTRLMLVR